MFNELDVQRGDARVRGGADGDRVRDVRVRKRRDVRGAEQGVRVS